MDAENNSVSLNFLEEIIQNDLQEMPTQEILTRFPPEPNGYLHIGHAKAISLNFGLAKRFGGKTNLRFDDTNPITEDTEYVKSIQHDIQWLGYQWAGEPKYASDYFDDLYQYARKLIQKSLAYVDDTTQEEMREMRGTPTKPGIESPFKSRSIEENIALFEGMKNGDFADGSKVLRAKIDMSSPNMHMRDPVLYRILHAHHHKTGDQWCIYPMYDFAHGQSDSIEKVSHSFCTIEFEIHRPLYNWFINELEIFPSKQREFARLNVSNTITSKRKLLQLIEENLVSGWDDPRMPTISGMRRRGYTAAGIRNFMDKIGVSKRNHIIELSLLEYAIREDLNKIAHRVMVVLQPMPVEIVNFPEDNELLPIENNPEKESDGSREVAFGKHIFIESDDFKVDANRKYFRLAPGKPVRLKGAYIIEYVSHEEEDGVVTKVFAKYHKASRSGNDTSGIKVKGTIHWVERDSAVSVEVRNYNRLFVEENPLKDKEVDFKTHLNPESLVVNENALAEGFCTKATFDTHYQFLRKGYYFKDPDSTDEKLVFNRTVTLRDTWSKRK